MIYICVIFIIVIKLGFFIRDTKAQNLKINDIYMCYFYNSNQIGENVKYAEAEPSWVVEVGNEMYIYSAYTGNYSKKIMNNE